MIITITDHSVDYNVSYEIVDAPDGGKEISIECERLEPKTFTVHINANGSIAPYIPASEGSINHIIVSEIMDIEGLPTAKC